MRLIKHAVLLGSLALTFVAIQTPALSAPVGPVSTVGTLTEIAHGMGAPDDVAVSADGTIYFSDLGVNRVLALTSDGTVKLVSVRLQEPEGIVVLSDGTLIVAEQGTNRLYRLDPATQKMTAWYAVGNRTANPGIDGLSSDPASGDLLIPDSPSGRLLRLSADGQKLIEIAAGFRRPTGLALAPDGTLYVCDEYGPAIFRLTLDSTGRAQTKAQLVARLPLPDDVLLAPDGTLVVNSLAGTIWQIDPTTGKLTALVTGLSAPHGISWDINGDLIFADATLNRLYRLALPHPPIATPSITPTFAATATS
ncbi:MAG: Vgb family protein [Aggregatilineales bacterium]